MYPMILLACFGVTGYCVSTFVCVILRWRHVLLHLLRQHRQLLSIWICIAPEVMSNCGVVWLTTDLWYPLSGIPRLWHHWYASFRSPLLAVFQAIISDSIMMYNCLSLLVFCASTHNPSTTDHFKSGPSHNTFTTFSYLQVCMRTKRGLEAVENQ